MKKVTFFVVIPTLLLATLSCTAMKPISLTQSQQNKYLSDGWVLIPSKTSTIHSITTELPYSDSIMATIKYKPAQNSIKLCYSDTQTHRIYANSSFALPKNQREASKLNFAFVAKKAIVIIALNDTYFTYPIPTNVIAQDNIKK
jgi:hypothetical protein